VIIVHGKTPVAELVPIAPSRPVRPRPGAPTTTGVRWTDDAFRPMTEEELAAWGL
jgi:antitoxin (DNA-binding transcriptional repressor) of toxin-antitoxin stability system